MSADPVKKYLAAIGRRGGKSKSPAKSAASRANGKRGGRPKKAARSRYMNTGKN